MRAEPNAAWSVTTLGALADKERAAFYESLDGDQLTEHFTFGGGDSRLFENPRFEVGIVRDDGTIVAAEQFRPGKYLSDRQVNVYVERYFAAAMPGTLFDLQIAISSRHFFSDRPEPERVSHTLAVRGVMGDYSNYLSEPVFWNLKVASSLTLDIAVTFATDRSTERLLQFLKSPELQKGIQLVQTYNPIFGTAASYVRGVVESMASAKKNTPITDAHMTFVSKPGDLSVPLVPGTYLLVQPSTLPENLMAQKPRYDRDLQRVLVEGGPLDRNHLLLRVEALD